MLDAPSATPSLARCWFRITPKCDIFVLGIVNEVDAELDIA